MRIDPDTCRDPDLLAAEVRRLRAVLNADDPRFTDEPAGVFGVRRIAVAVLRAFAVSCMWLALAAGDAADAIERRLRWRQ